MFSKRNNTKGQVGIALHDGGVTIGQCTWKNGEYANPRVLRIDKNPRDLTADCWRNILTQSSNMGSDCVLSLPPSIAYHQVLRLPNMLPSELKEAAAWEMVDRLGVERSSLQLDAIPIGDGGDVLAVAIDQNTLAGLLEPLYSAGFCPTAIEPHCISVARTLSMLHRRQSDSTNVRAVFDFGMHDSAFMVIAGDALVFYKQLKHSGTSLIESISSQTNVTTAQAESMLENLKSDTKDKEISKAVRDATRATHEAIATDAMKCIRHYGVTNRGPVSAQLVVSGSSGWNPFLAQALDAVCSQNIVKVGDVRHIQALPESVTLANGWHVALGASLTGLSSQRQRRGSDLITKEAA
jgi:Tfp pilus assembly PilM family ATPase